MQKRIILDTGFLIIPSTLRIDIFEEIRRIADFDYMLYILDKSIDELEHRAKKRDKPGMAAKLGLLMIKAKGVKIIKTASQMGVDDILVDNSSKEDVIATTDNELRNRLKNRGIKVISVRQKSYLMLS